MDTANIIALFVELIYVISVLAIVVIVISENRNPIKTVAWVLAVVFLPIIGIIWYLIFGQDFGRKHFMTKRMYRNIKDMCLVDANAISTTCPEEHKSLIDLLLGMNQAPLLNGNKVDFFTDGTSKFDRLFQDIENAKHHIHLEYYVLEEDTLGLKLQETLIRKAKEGVEIRIIYDSFGSKKVKRRHFEKYRINGIEIEPFLKLALPNITSRLNYRNHRKIVVIDGEIGYIGGMNFSDRYVNGFNWGIWRDTHVRIQGVGAHGLQSVFLLDWYFVSQTMINDRTYFPSIENYGNNPMQIVSSGPIREFREIPHGIVQALYNANEKAYIQTPYFLPPDSMIEALQAAAMRGVDVKIMVSKRSDVNFVQLASLSYIKTMLKSGVKVYFYTKGFLHSKLMVFDKSLTIIGSSNFDARSFDHNFEVEAFIYDKNTASEAIEIFEQDLQDCEEAQLKDWLKRSKSIRFFESFLRLFSPLL